MVKYFLADQVVPQLRQTTKIEFKITLEKSSRYFSDVKVPVELVKDLRTRTGAGYADCKNALVASSNDVDKAVEWLRKKGAVRVRFIANLFEFRLQQKQVELPLKVYCVPM